MSLESRTNNYENNYLSVFLNDACVVGTISLFLILYAVLIAPRLPNCVLRWFNNWIVQIALFFAIVYISTQNITLALITTIAVLITLMVANNQKISKSKNIENYSNTRDYVSQNKSETYENKNYEDDEYNEYNDHNELDINLHEPTTTHQTDNIVGVMEDHIENNNHTMSGMRNFITKDNMLSVIRPFIKNSRLEIEDQEKLSIVGVEEKTIESESIGSFLKENMPIAMNEKSINSGDQPVIKSRLLDSTNAITSFITRVKNKLQESNINIPVGLQEQVMNELTSKISQIVKYRPVSESDITNAYFNIYRKYL